MPALIAMFRMAIPWVLSTLGGWFASDVFNERQKALAAQQKPDYPVIFQRVAKNRAAFWRFLAVASLIIGVIIAFLTKRLSK